MSVSTATLLKDVTKKLDVIYDGIVIVYSLWIVGYIVMVLIVSGRPLMTLYLSTTTLISSVLEYCTSFYFIYLSTTVTNLIRSSKFKEQSRYYTPMKTLEFISLTFLVAHLLPLCYAIFFHGLPNGFPAFSTLCVLLGLNLANSYSLRFKKNITYNPYKLGFVGYTNAKFVHLFTKNRSWMPTIMFLSAGFRIVFAIIIVTPVLKDHHPMINYLYMIVSPAYTCCFVFFGTFLLQTSLLQVISLEK